MGLFVDLFVFKTNTALEFAGAVVLVMVVVIEIVEVAGAVEVETSADVVDSKQSKLLHGQPAGQFA